MCKINLDVGSLQKAIYHSVKRVEWHGLWVQVLDWWMGDMLHPDANNLTLKLNEKQINFIGDSFSVDKVFKKKCLWSIFAEEKQVQIDKIVCLQCLIPS